MVAMKSMAQYALRAIAPYVLLFSVQAHAEYPAKPVYLVMPSSQGSTGDLVGRLLAQRLAEAMGQPVYPENRPGLNGVTATEAVARAPNDGYVLLQGIETIVINPHLYRLSVDPLRDLTPISLTTRDPVAIAVHPSVPARTLPELVAYGKANPGQLNIGASSRVAAELFKQSTGVDGEIILYRGASNAVSDAIKGIVHVTVNNLAAFLPYAKSDRLRLLAVTDTARYPALPDVPAAAETLPGYESGGWTALLGPAGLPIGVLSRVNSETMKAVHAPAMRDRLEQSGSIPVGSSPRELAQWMRNGYEQWRRVVQAAGIGPE